MEHKLHLELVEIVLRLPAINDFRMRSSLLIGIPERLLINRSGNNVRLDINRIIDQLTPLHLAGSGEWLVLIFLANVLPYIDNDPDRVRLQEIIVQLKNAD